MRKKTMKTTSTFIDFPVSDWVQGDPYLNYSYCHVQIDMPLEKYHLMVFLISFSPPLK